MMSYSYLCMFQSLCMSLSCVEHGILWVAYEYEYISYVSVH